MHDIWPLTVVIALGCVALFSRTLGNSPITMPMVCLGFGLMAYGVGGVPFGAMQAELTIVAEITLSIVLFTDAAHLKIAELRDGASWSLRMLVVGGVLSLVVGTLLFLPLFPTLPFLQIALLAALLTPTDAALSQAVISNPAIPEKVRSTLTAESGLNDGLALPAIIFLACAAVGGNHDLAQSNWFLFAIKQVFFGVGFGAIAGMAGGWASNLAIERGFAVESNSAVFGLLLVAIVYFGAEAVGGNSFVAVFVAGLLFGRFARECGARVREFLDTDGILLMMIAFFYIGAILLPPGLANVDWRIVLAVLLALFVIRPAAIALSLTGSGATWRVKLFFGWFGPRGLATALFTLVVLSSFKEHLMSDTILAVAALAVAVSTVLHGVSAHYAADWFRDRD